MENQIDTQFSQEAEMQPKRPQFLTVLCILSFICAGLMFLFSVIGIAMNSPEKQLENIEQMRQFSPATADQFEAQLMEQQNSVMGKIQPYLSLLFLIVGVLGVIQMYNLNKGRLLFIYSHRAYPLCVHVVWRQAGHGNDGLYGDGSRSRGDHYHCINAIDRCGIHCDVCHESETHEIVTYFSR